MYFLCRDWDGDYIIVRIIPTQVLPIDSARYEYDLAHGMSLFDGGQRVARAIETECLLNVRPDAT